MSNELSDCPRSQELGAACSSEICEVVEFRLVLKVQFKRRRRLSLNSYIERHTYMLHKKKRDTCTFLLHYQY